MFIDEECEIDFDNADFKEYYEDLKMLEFIQSGNFDMFFSKRTNFLKEAFNDIKNAIELFDKNYIVGAYGYLYATVEVLRVTLYLFQNKEKLSERVGLFLGKNNQFKNIFKDKDNWENFEEVLSEFPSYNAKIYNSNERINKIRHKHSFFYIDSLSNKINLNNSELFNEIKEDIEFIIAMYLITWLVLDPTIILFTNEEITSRYPDALSDFPSSNLTGKYLPELKNANFAKNFSLTRYSYSEIVKKYKYSEEQSLFKQLHKLSKSLKISKSQRMYFTKNELTVYDFYKQNSKPDYHHIFISESGSIYWSDVDGFRSLTQINYGDMWIQNQPGQYFDFLTKIGWKVSKHFFNNIILITVKPSKVA